MRIISGKARGTILYSLEGQNTRPTLDRVKESLFNILQSDLYDSNFLDLFSGSGAIGLEAASRGAKKVILCDNSKQACDIIKKNIEKTHLTDSVLLYNLNYSELLNNKIKDKLDYIYIDPPYISDFGIDAIKILVENKKIYQDILDENSLIIIETDDKEKYLKELKNKVYENKLKIVDERKYGRANLIFLKKLKYCKLN